ncbi:formyl-CoA transferase [Hydrogenophaga sp. Root209]|uniref:CaiB/BaiF CoA transferase family protein n=1 Tax=Hydrogenophaga sp. Root209 TaxID=1736490 RepID=UPI0006F2F0DF|nr:CaiB/BaiF CoA-transferase family protein [Hydrogenophaga sp. Root209]KRB99501.1 formyl-CoA transferase [Hydrogenophaga sp. Root209]
MSTAKPLAGIRVLDFGSFITAPYAAMLMGELGADVIKVERPGSGDPFRAFNGGLYSSHFQAHNRNKRSVALEHSAPHAAQALQALIESADVLLLNVRPGVENKTGLGYERVRSLNPRIVYCSITGYGASGPYAERAAYDNVGQALSGWLSMFHQGEDARVAGPAVSDALTGLFATIGVLAALTERSSTGIGRKVEVSMLESMVAFATEPLARLFSTGKPSSFYSRAAASQSFIVTCKDGERIGLHLSSPPKFWEGLIAAIGTPSLLQKYADRGSRVKRYDELSEDLAHIFLQHPRDHWLPLLEVHDVPFAPERRLEDLSDDPQVVHQRVFYTVEHPVEGIVKAAHRPVRFDGDNRSDFRAPPTLGEHTQEVLLEVGLDTAAIQQLADQGLIG